MRTTCVFLLTAAANLAACGSNSNATIDGGADAPAHPTNEVLGQVEGRTFAAKDAISKPFDHTNGFGFNGTATFVEMTDFAGACGLTAQDVAPTDSRILDIGVAIDDAAGNATSPTGPGVFTVFPSSGSLPAGTKVAKIYYGSGCDKSVAYGGTTGTVTVTTVKADGGLEGTFDITVSCASFSSCAGPDVHLTGSFASSACGSLNVNVIPNCS
jgi:hypothetical protein